MTRINTFPVHLLSNSHLIAEYRELPRIPNRVANGKPYHNIPDTYRMGTGHESFFGDKIAYLHIRHLQILAELQRRTLLYPDRFSGNYTINIDATCETIATDCPDVYNGWQPTKEAQLANVQRVIERLLGAGKMDYYGDQKLATPEDIWELIVEPIGWSCGIIDEVIVLFQTAYNNLAKIKNEAEQRRNEIRSYRKKQESK